MISNTKSIVLFLLIAFTMIGTFYMLEEVTKNKNTVGLFEFMWEVLKSYANRS